MNTVASDGLRVVIEWMAARRRQFRRRLAQAHVELNRIYANLLQDKGVTVHLPAGFQGLSVRHLQHLIRMNGPGRGSRRRQAAIAHAGDGGGAWLDCRGGRCQHHPRGAAAASATLLRHRDRHHAVLVHAHVCRLCCELDAAICTSASTVNAALAHACTVRTCALCRPSAAPPPRTGGMV